jgi:septal ring factor EnvC (AmiA/AmiB activator)
MKLRVRGALAFLLLAATAAGFPTTDRLLSAPPAPASPPRAPPQVLGDVERLLSELDRRETSARRELERLRQEVAQARARTLVRGRAYVRMARAGLLPIGSGFNAFVDHAAGLERLQRSLTRDLELEQRLAARRTELDKKLTALRAERGPLEAERQILAQAQATLLSAQDREQAFLRAFTPSGPSPHSAVYGAGIGPTDPSDSSVGFAGMKGRLPFPLSGRSEILSARRAGSGPGLEMRAPMGSPVRSVFAGRVAFADTYADYGRTVILDHGESHYTVSANLGSVEVRTGDEVPGGARIGTVGDAGKGALLYFEVRVGTETVDPAEWFGI